MKQELILFPMVMADDGISGMWRHRRPQFRRYFRTPGWRRIPNLAGAGRGSCADGCCHTKKLIFDG
jgi:hypothetical protein